MVLIFSRPYCSASSSKAEKIRFSIANTCDGDMLAATWVKFTMSANITVTSAKPSAMVLSEFFSRSAMGAGKDVEQQLFGALLLGQDLLVGFFETLLRLALFRDRQAQQHVDDGRHRDEVEGEKYHRGAYRHVGLLCDHGVDEV
jgi:hypothetical protein